MKALDIYEQVTGAVIRDLESGAADPTHWRPCWQSAGAMPRNAATGRAYKGGNVVGLWVAELRGGYGSAWWATYRQWAELGRQVTKGQKATYCVKWVEPSGKRDRAGARPGEHSVRELTAPRIVPIGFAVFHYEQTEPATGFAGECWEPPAPASSPDPIPECARFVAELGADIRAGEPAYVPAGDYVTMPELGAFEHAVGYYGTLAHELTHWSGHKSRLARDLSGRFGTEQYAAEELVAELGAAFLCAMLGIEPTPRPDHAHYIASWLRVLRGDPKALHKAASLAQAAADYLQGRAGAETAPATAA